MVGFDVGATTIAQSTGLQVPLEMQVPRDLLLRVAQHRPVVSTAGGEVTLREAHELYAEAVADAIHRGAHDPHAHDPHSQVALAVPGWWAPSAVDRVTQALAARDVNVRTVNEAEAAVAEQQSAGVDLPDTVIVVSLRATHSSAVLVQQCAGATHSTQPRALQSPTFVIAEGGDDLDAAVLRHLVAGLQDLGSAIDPRDGDTLAAAAPALLQCQDVRERLSFTTTESVDLMLPGAVHRVRLVRSELEEITRPWVGAIVRTVIEALELSDDRVEAVLLTGGLAAMPLVSQRLSAELGLEVIVPAEPRLVVARGATLLAERMLDSSAPASRRWSHLFSPARLIRRAPRTPRTPLTSRAVLRQTPVTTISNAAAPTAATPASDALGSDASMPDAELSYDSIAAMFAGART